MRRSRRNGQLRRVSSITRGSHFATSTAGSVPASAMILVGLRHLKRKYRESALYGDDPD